VALLCNGASTRSSELTCLTSERCSVMEGQAEAVSSLHIAACLQLDMSLGIAGTSGSEALAT
jgi:hypothetical protein